MKKLRAWFTVGSFAFLGSATAVSCGGDDEATGDGNRGGGGTIDGGGSGGTAGSTTTPDAPVTTGELGRDCITDAECGEGLICIARDDVDTLGGAPPGGLCTLACDSDDICLEHSSNAWCAGFDNGAYCLEGCLIDAGLAEKCHGRIDFVCSGVDFAPIGPTCVDNTDCTEPETVCLSGECNAVLTLCLPSCGSDADCASGLFCDFMTGLCNEAAPEGKDFNEACNPASTADPPECAGGICFETYDNPEVGTCSGLCNLGNPFSCGYTGDGPADSACLFGTILSGDQAEIGDLGYCGQLCDCNDDCSAQGEVCRPFNEPVLEELWIRLGYCVPIIDGGTFTADQAIGPCEGGAPGVGGAGGTPAQGGSSGEAPTPGGGAGGAGGG